VFIDFKLRNYRQPQINLEQKLKLFNTVHIRYSYRIEHAMEINLLTNISLKNEPSVIDKIVYAVNIHREAMKLV